MGAADDERRPGLVWLVIVVALLLVIGAAAFAIRLLAGSGTTKTVTVPSIVGMTPTAAAQALKNDGLVPATGDPTSGPCAGGRTVTEGLVCLVTPEVGAKVKDKSTVTFQVFEKRKVQLQTYVGEDYTQAANEVNGLGLRPVRQDVNSSQPADTVVQQSPSPYTTVVVGSTVTLQVSTGKVVLPDVRGKPVADAQTALNTQGWTKVSVSSTIVATTDKAKDGTVAVENPQPGIAYPQSTQVTLTAYKYVPPTPTSTPTPTCTTTPTPTTSAPTSSGSSSSSPPATPSGQPSC
jgi:serine/threonine-protein kinase